MKEALNMFCAMRAISFYEEGSWFVHTEGCCLKNGVLSVI